MASKVNGRVFGPGCSPGLGDGLVIVKYRSERIAEGEGREAIRQVLIAVLRIVRQPLVRISWSAPRLDVNFPQNSWGPIGDDILAPIAGPVPRSESSSSIALRLFKTSLVEPHLGNAPFSPLSPVHNASTWSLARVS